MNHQGSRISAVFVYMALSLVVGTMVYAAQLIAHEQTKPIQLHPENPHYFLWRSKPTILITS